MPASLRNLTCLLAATLLLPSARAEPVPGRLQGTWRITRILPTRNVACWGQTQAQPLVGSRLTYGDGAMRWQGGQVPVNDVVTRMVSATDFERENGGSGGAASFAQLGIHAPSVLEVDFQHEDMDITGATTEVPGDSVLMAGPNRIVVSACGVFFEATRAGGVAHTVLHR